MTGRQRLPDRRQCVRYSFQHAGFAYQGVVGLRPETGEPAEVFLATGKVGSAIEDLARDAAVLASLAIQHGATVAGLRHSLTRLDNGEPAGAVCKLLDLFVRDRKVQP